MSATNDDDGYRAEVDKEDGGPASHTEDGSGGSVNDVASGGVSRRRNEDNEDLPADGESDVYDDGEPTD